MKYRHAIIVPAAIQAACNAAAVQLGIDPEGRMDTMCIPLQETQGGGVTHYGATGCMNDTQRVYLEANQASFPGARWWRWIDAGEDKCELAASWDGENLGEDWSWDKSLQACGLIRFTIPLQ